MCVMSAIHDYGGKLSPSIWDQPQVYPAFEKLIEVADLFDKAAKQPHCEDPEKTAFMEALRKKHGAELDKTKADAKAEADRLRNEVRSLKRQLAVAEADIKVQQEALMEAHAEHEQTKDDYDALKIGYARLAIDATLKVKVSGSGEYFTAIEIELPTGPIRFHIDNQYADLLAGLPYGLVGKGALDRETQGLRLTQAFNYDFDQSPIVEPVTPESILNIFPEPIDATPVKLVGVEDSCSALVVDGGIRPAGPLAHLFTVIGDGSGVALPNLSGAARYSPQDVTMLGGVGVGVGSNIGFVGAGSYNPPGSGAGGAIIRVNGEVTATIGNHAQNGGHVG